MDFDFTASELAFRDEIDQFLTDHLTPRLRRAQAVTASVFPEAEIAIEWQRILHARGWGAPAWPREHGGTGWSLIERYIFESRCAAANAPLQYPLGLKMVGPVIMKFGSPEQRAFYLPRIVSGEDYWCQGYSEPGAGSDLASLRTRAVRDGDDYVVTGSKIWTTHAHHANRMFALVRTDDSGKKQAGLSFLLLDMDSPGLTVRPIITIGGDHEVNEVFLDSVRVPATNLVGREGEGWSYGKYLLEFERGGSMSAPRLRAQLDQVRALSRQREDGRPATGEALSEIEIEIDALEMIELRIMSTVQSGGNPGAVASSLLKLRASRIRQVISELSLEILGLDALPWEAQRPLYDVEHESEAELVAVPRYFDDRAHTIFGGTSEIQHDILARALIGY